MVVQQVASVELLEAVYRERYVHVALAITRSHDTAVDAVQEAFASALRSRAAFRGDGSVEAWIWRAVMNAALRSFRHRPLELPSTPADGEPDLAVDDEVRALVAALPERQRLVLFLRYYADLDYRAIAEALELEVGTVGATLTQAHAALRRRLAEAAS